MSDAPKTGVCMPFSRLGSCRYGINCSSNHVKPSNLEEMKIFVLLNLLPNDFLATQSEQEIEEIYVSLFNTFNKFGEVRDIIINRNSKSLFIDGNVYVQYANEGSLKHCLESFSDNLQFNGHFVEFNVVSQIRDLSEIVCKYYHQSTCTNDNCTGIHYHRFPEEQWAEVDAAPNGRKFSIRDKLLLTSHKIWSGGRESRQNEPGNSLDGRDVHGNGARYR